MTTCLQAAEPTGASLAWTSTHATVSAARTLVEKGDFAGAEAILRAMKDDEPAGAEMLEMITPCAASIPSKPANCRAAQADAARCDAGGHP